MNQMNLIHKSFVGKNNAFMMGRQSLDLTKQQKNNIWPCIQIPRFSRVLIILIWIKVQNVFRSSNFSTTQPRNSPNALKHTFSSVKVKQIFTRILWVFRFQRKKKGARVCARAQKKSNGKKNFSAFQRWSWKLFRTFFDDCRVFWRSLCLRGQHPEEYFKEFLNKTKKVQHYFVDTSVN